MGGWLGGCGWVWVWVWVWVGKEGGWEGGKVGEADGLGWEGVQGWVEGWGEGWGEGWVCGSWSRSGRVGFVGVEDYHLGDGLAHCVFVFIIHRHSKPIITPNAATAASITTRDFTCPGHYSYCRKNTTLHNPWCIACMSCTTWSGLRPAFGVAVSRSLAAARGLP